MKTMRLATMPVLLLFACSAWAQQPTSPYQQVAPGTTALRTFPVPQPSLGFGSDVGSSAYIVATPPAGRPYSPYAPYGYGPYGYGTIESPAAGYLRGAADLTNANGYYLSQVQQARVLQTQADLSKLDLRLRIIQQDRYLRSLQPTPEEIRQKDIIDAINRSRNNPPPTEIWSGKALNDLLLSISREQRGGKVGPTVPVAPETLAHINLTNGVALAGAGALKDLRKFQWPLALLEPTFDKDRSAVEKLARSAADEAARNSVDPRVVRDLDKALENLMATTKATVSDMTPTEYVKAMRYLRELSESFKVLQDANVANYFNDKYSAQGKTIAELIAGMNDRGLKFAPAISGDEPYYTTLHGLLVSYDYGLLQVASTR